MTISSSISKSGPYNGNGVTTVFARTFRILSDNHLKVYKTLDGVTTEVTSGITHDGIGSDSGNVTFSVAPEAGSQITLIRKIPLTQETDYSSQGKVSPEQVEDDFDLQEMKMQDQQRDLDRSIKLSNTSSLLNVEIDDPVSGLAVIGSPDGSGFVNGPNAGDIAGAQSYAERAEAAMAAAILYQGYWVTDKTDLATVNAPDLPLGEFIVVRNTMQVLERVADGTAGADFDYSGAGGVTLNYVSASNSVGSVGGVLSLDVSERSTVRVAMTEAISRIRVTDWPLSVRDVVIVFEQPDSAAHDVRFPLHWYFEGVTPPAIAVVSGSATTVRLRSENAGQTVTYAVETVTSYAPADYVFNQVGLGFFEAPYSEIKVPTGTDVVYVPFVLDRPCVSTVNAKALLTDGSSTVEGVATFPNDEYYIWRTGDDLTHFVAVDISSVTRVDGEYFTVTLDGTYYRQKSISVRITLDDSAATHVEPNPMPFHRPYRRVFMDAGPPPAFALDIANAEWSDSGYNGDGDAVLRSRLGGGTGYYQAANPESGLYMSDEIWPSDAVTPHSIATDGEGTHLLLNSVKLPSPVSYDGQTWNYQATVLTGQMMTDLHIKKYGLWRMKVTVPSRQYAWSALWCTGILGTAPKWPFEIDILESFNQGDFPLDGYHNSINQHCGVFGSGQRSQVYGSQIDLHAFLGDTAPNTYNDVVEYVMALDEVTEEVTVFMGGIEVYAGMIAATHHDPNTTDDWGYYPIMNIAVHSGVGSGAYTDGSGQMKVRAVERYDAAVAAFTTVPPPPSVGLLASFDPHKEVTLSDGVIGWGSELDAKAFIMNDETRRPLLKTNRSRGSLYAEFTRGTLVTTGSKLQSDGGLLSGDPDHLSYVAVLSCSDFSDPVSLVFYNAAFGVEITITDQSTITVGHTYQVTNLFTADVSIPDGEMFVLSIRVTGGGAWSVRINGAEVDSGTTAETFRATVLTRGTDIQPGGPVDLYYMALSETYLSDTNVADMEAHAALVARAEDLLA